ncbi:MAG: T9SS type A sorting domain-containing protein, partial [Chitinophagales bacterium]
DIITSATNGIGFRPDDHANTFSDASVASFYNNQFNLSGVVERNTDQDVFTFALPASGRFQLDAVPYNVGTGNAGSDLDMQVTLYNASQTFLNVFNPGTLLSSVIDTTLNAGVYYVKVEGKGNMYAPAYASLGSYSLQAQATPATTLALNKLELRGNLNGDKHELSWIIDATEAVTNQRLEISTDGRNFQSLAQISNNDRSYIYRPYNAPTAEYRLNVTFSNGHQYYSNVVAINGDLPGPKLTATIVHSNKVTVTSPGNYNYLVTDINGKILNKGKLASGINTINIVNMAAGMYLIHFSDDSRQWTDKIIRQ